MIVRAEQAGFGEEIPLAGTTQNDFGALRRKSRQAYLTLQHTIHGIHFVTEAEDALPLAHIHGMRRLPKRVRKFFYPIFCQDGPLLFACWKISQATMPARTGEPPHLCLIANKNRYNS